MTHHKNYKSLKSKIYRLEQQIKKLSKKFDDKAKCCLRDWVGWWANFMKGGKTNATQKKSQKRR